MTNYIMKTYINKTLSNLFRLVKLESEYNPNYRSYIAFFLKCIINKKPVFPCPELGEELRWNIHLTYDDLDEIEKHHHGRELCLWMFSNLRVCYLKFHERATAREWKYLVYACIKIANHFEIDWKQLFYGVLRSD